ncbi:nucleotidyltransferase domain-containing protein [Paenibacillus lacisoli]
MQGSRAKGTAKPTSDIDIAIRVPSGVVNKSAV